MGQTQRVFIAIALPDALAVRMKALQDQLKNAGLKLRWVRPANIHLTLKFLGDLPPVDSEFVSDLLARICRRHPALQLTVQGLGVFPGFRKPRVLWTGVGGQTRELFSLQQDVEAELAQAGIPREKRPFKGHLTLGRFKQAAPPLLANAVETVGGFDPLAFNARQVTLFKSDLRPQGAVYTGLGHYELQG